MWGELYEFLTRPVVILVILKSIGLMLLFWFIGGIAGSVVATVLGFVGWILGARITDDFFRVFQGIGMALGAGIGFFAPIIDERDRRAKIREERLATIRNAERLNEESRRNAKRALEKKHDELRQLCAALKEQPPKVASDYLSSVKAQLENARRYYHEEAYSLFWDSAERGLHLVQSALYEERTFRSRLEHYNAEATVVKPSHGRLSLSFCEFEVFHSLKQELLALVEAAHRNYHFVMVYEARKTRNAELERIRAEEEEERRRDDD